MFLKSAVFPQKQFLEYSSNLLRTLVVAGSRLRPAGSDDGESREEGATVGRIPAGLSRGMESIERCRRPLRLSRERRDYELSVDSEHEQQPSWIAVRSRVARRYRHTYGQGELLFVVCNDTTKHVLPSSSPSLEFFLKYPRYS